MKKKITVLTLCATLFALCVAADAQQPGKIFRIGFLDNSTASGSAVVVDAFRLNCASLDGLKEKISASSIGLPSKRPSACQSWRQSWFVSGLI